MSIIAPDLYIILYEDLIRVQGRLVGPQNMWSIADDLVVNLENYTDFHEIKEIHYFKNLI